MALNESGAESSDGGARFQQLTPAPAAARPRRRGQRHSFAAALNRALEGDLGSDDDLFPGAPIAKKESGAAATNAGPGEGKKRERRKKERKADAADLQVPEPTAHQGSDNSDGGKRFRATPTVRPRKSRPASAAKLPSAPNEPPAEGSDNSDGGRRFRATRQRKSRPGSAAGGPGAPYQAPAEAAQQRTQHAPASAAPPQGGAPSSLGPPGTADPAEQPGMSIQEAVKRKRRAMSAKLSARKPADALQAIKAAAAAGEGGTSNNNLPGQPAGPRMRRRLGPGRSRVLGDTEVDPTKEKAGDESLSDLEGLRYRARGAAAGKVGQKAGNFADSGSEVEPDEDQIRSWNADLQVRADTGLRDLKTAFSIKEVSAPAIRRLGPKAFLGGKRMEEGGKLLFDADGKVNIHFMLGTYREVLRVRERRKRGDETQSAIPEDDRHYLKWLVKRARELRVINGTELRRGRITTKRLAFAKRSGSFSLALDTNLAEVSGDEAAADVPMDGPAHLDVQFPKRMVSKESREADVGGVQERLRSHVVSRQTEITTITSHNVDLQKMQDLLTAPRFSFSWEEKGEEDEDEDEGGLDVLPDAQSNESRRNMFRNELKRSVSFNQLARNLGKLQRTSSTCSLLGQKPELLSKEERALKRHGSAASSAKGERKREKVRKSRSSKELVVPPASKRRPSPADSQAAAEADAESLLQREATAASIDEQQEPEVKPSAPSVEEEPLDRGEQKVGVREEVRPKVDLPEGEPTAAAPLDRRGDPAQLPAETDGQMPPDVAAAPPVVPGGSVEAVTLDQGPAPDAIGTDTVAAGMDEVAASMDRAEVRAEEVAISLGGKMAAPQIFAKQEEQVMSRMDGNRPAAEISTTQEWPDDLSPTAMWADPSQREASPPGGHFQDEKAPGKDAGTSFAMPMGAVISPTMPFEAPGAAGVVISPTMPFELPGAPAGAAGVAISPTLPFDPQGEQSTMGALDVPMAEPPAPDQDGPDPHGGQVLQDQALPQLDKVNTKAGEEAKRQLKRSASCMSEGSASDSSSGEGARPADDGDQIFELTTERHKQHRQAERQWLRHRRRMLRKEESVARRREAAAAKARKSAIRAVEEFGTATMSAEERLRYELLLGASPALGREAVAPPGFAAAAGAAVPGRVEENDDEDAALFGMPAARGGLLRSRSGFLLGGP